MAPKTEQDPKWFDTEGTFKQVDDSPGGDDYEARVEAALEELVMTGPEVKPTGKKEIPDGATHRVGKDMPIQVVGDYRMFADGPVYLMRISGGKGKGKGPATYRALESFGAHMDRRHVIYEADCIVYAPKVGAVTQPAKPTK